MTRTAAATATRNDNPAVFAAAEREGRMDYDDGAERDENPFAGHRADPSDRWADVRAAGWYAGFDAACYAEFVTTSAN